MSYISNLPTDISEDDLKALQNLEKKRLAALSFLGDKWVLHEKHKPKNKGLSMNFVGAHIKQEGVSA